MTEIRAGVCHFHSHSIDQSSVICSPNYKAVSEMQPRVSPVSRGKDMNVAGAVEAVSATQESLNLLSSFLSTLNQTNTTHKKAHFHWLSGSDWRPCCIINLALVPLPNAINACQGISFCFVSFNVLGNPALPLYLDQAPGSLQRAVQGLAPEDTNTPNLLLSASDWSMMSSICAEWLTPLSPYRQRQLQSNWVFLIFKNQIFFQVPTLLSCN